VGVRACYPASADEDGFAAEVAFAASAIVPAAFSDAPAADVVYLIVVVVVVVVVVVEDGGGTAVADGIDCAAAAAAVVVVVVVAAAAAAAASDAHVHLCLASSFSVHPHAFWLLPGHVSCAFENTLDALEELHHDAGFLVSVKLPQTGAQSYFAL
jgi:hypothetical protein